MQTTALDRTKIGTLCIISCVEFSLVFMTASRYHFYQLVIQNSLLTGVLGSSRDNKVGCLDDIVAAVNISAKPNYSQLVGSQDGTSLIPMYNWSEFFEEYTIKRALKGITNMHHFQFSKSYPGKVKVKNTLNDSERTINLLKTTKSWLPTSNDLPNELIPAGLSLERQWYLYEKIREYCPEDEQDLVCPKPSLQNKFIHCGLLSYV